MNLKNKIALNVSLLFSVFLGAVLFIIYLFFAEFRKEEFTDILKDRIYTVANYFTGGRDEAEVQNLELITSTPTYAIQKEEILVFNKEFELVYSSVIDMEVDWSNEDLRALRDHGMIYRRENDSEIYGEKINGRYFMIESEDILGKEKLDYLSTVMLIVFFTGSALVWILSFLFARKVMAPLDLFQEKITRISANNLNERLPETDRRDEINLLAKVFNTMLRRIDKSYSSQKEFTASASHEIKTPLTRIAFQLENLSGIEKHNPETAGYISRISEEVYQLSDIVNSLLLLAKLEEQELQREFTDVRIDEVIFDAFGNVKKNFPDFQLHFNINDNEYSGELTVRALKPLLDTVFINLFKNACLYSYIPFVEVEITEDDRTITAVVMSRGQLITETEKENLFEAFRRGADTQFRSGSGLGLRICQRILEFHQAAIAYHSAGTDQNIFTVTFRHL